MHTHVWVVGSLSGAPWGFLEGRKDPSQPRDSCRMPGAPFAALAFGSVPVIPQGNAGKTKCLHHSVASAEIPISGSWLESQRMAERNKWNVGGSPAYPSHQADVPSSMLLGKSISSAHPLLPPTRRCVGTWRCQFPRRTPQLLPYPEFPLVFQDQTALQGRGRGGTVPAGAPGGTGTPGEVWPCGAAALRGDRWPE